MVIKIIHSPSVQEERLKPYSPNSYQFAFLWMEQFCQRNLFLLLWENTILTWPQEAVRLQMGRSIFPTMCFRC